MTNLKSLTILVALGVSACSFGVGDNARVYTDKSGKDIPIQSNRGACESACNSAYSVCMDSFAAQSNPTPGDRSGTYGAAADCRSDLQSCLPKCLAR